jgi:serine/threonine-protein kinase
MDCLACYTPNIDGASFCAKCGAPLPKGGAAENDPLVGAIVGGRFRITGILGEGGMGRVYEGEQRMGTSVRKVAIKTLLAQFAKDPETVARFMRECGTVSELEHPNTIKVYDFGQTDSGELYIAMELLTGRSLETLLETEGAIAPERVDKIIAQVCGSLQEAHDKGIVHRDLKPANIQLSTRAGEDDYVKVLDFGIAKRGSSSTKQEQKLTQQGKILGTPPYMSPEQFRGGELDARSDIYSLGVMTYEMLTHRLPYDADTPWAWATQHMTAQPFPFETIAVAANVPPKMRGAVLRALSKEPAQRQQTAREFYDDLSIGTTRLSFVGSAPRGSSSNLSGGGAPSGGGGFATGPLPSRGGQTQVGEPIFPGGMPGGMGAPPAQRTMVDAPVMGPSAGAVPTAGGQAVPAIQPPMASGAKKGGGMGAILGIGGAAAVALVIGAVFLFKGGGKDDDGATPITIDAGPASSFTADPVPPPVDAGEAQTTPDAGKVAGNPTGGGPTGGGTSGGATSGGATSGGSGDPKADAACDATVSLSLGNNVGMAASQFRSCKGPKRDKALAALDSASMRKSKEGCRAKGELKQAASVGASSGFNALPKSCK